ncbi:MAG: hypothetical protein M3389_08460 [Actinomycetota bacterium]|nr:hypothetical protein [Actinomycetota bacterium]
MTSVRASARRVGLRLLLLSAICAVSVAGTAYAAPAPYSFSVNDVTVTEGDVNKVLATFTVTLSQASPTPTSVTLDTASGTAGISDYNPQPTTVLTFQPGTTAKTFQVSARADLVHEADETAFLNLSSPSGATIGDAQGVMTIDDNDPVPTLSVDDVTYTGEGAAGTKAPVGFTIRLSNPSSSAVSFELDTASNTATIADYNPRADVPLTIQPGYTTKRFEMNVRGDDLDEFDETFFLDASNVTNATIGDGRGTATIVDDDAAPTISIFDTTTAEPETGLALSRAKVQLSAPSGKDVFVDFSTMDGTAVGSPPPAETGTGDFGIRTNSTVRIRAGNTTTYAEVWVKSDEHTEGNEQFYDILSNAQNAIIDDNTGEVTIPGNCYDPEGDTAATAKDLGSISGDTGEERIDYDGVVCEGDVDWFKYTMTEDSTTTSRIDLTTDVYLTSLTSDLDLFAEDPAGTAQVWSASTNSYAVGSNTSGFSGTTNENVYPWQVDDPAAGVNDARVIYLKVFYDSTYEEPQDGPYRITILGNA